MTLENYLYRTDPFFLRNRFTENSGKYGIPVIPKPLFSSDELRQLRLLRFDQVKSDQGAHRNRMVHFFVYDYLFEKVWKKPEKWIELLRLYRGVLTPDFSMYIEMPEALQLYNTFRNRWCGAYFADHGLPVIPTVSWGEECSFSFCFEGIEKGSIVAVSTYMFHESGHHADQKDLFMAGYREILRRVEPEAVICYSEPFPEMEGNIIYVDYELSSWKHMEDDVVPAESIKHTHGILTLAEKRDIITKNGYVCKGGGSAGGGKWIPKNEDAERFKGQPNTIKVTRDKHGVKRETVIGKSGLAIRERHHTNHNRPDKHSEPHDHIITWDNLDEHPEPGPPINYSEDAIPDLHDFLELELIEPNLIELLDNGGKRSMQSFVDSKQYEDGDRFTSISDFKWSIHCGAEIEFDYHGQLYTIIRPEGHINIAKAFRPDTELESDDVEDILNYRMDDGKMLREVLTEVTDVIRTV